MDLVVGETCLGTTELEWAASPRLRSLPPLRDLHPSRVVVVAPHPDDEVFGTAGLVRKLQDRRVPVSVVAVTDGEASHPTAERIDDLRSIRSEESKTAMDRLGWKFPVMTRLGIPDGQVDRNIRDLVAALSGVLVPGDLCLAPWRRDGHPDHDACGEAALDATRSVGASFLGYLVWAWHWADPRGSDLPWGACRRLDFDRRTAARKRWATRAFVSQTQPFQSDPRTPVVLPPPLVRRFWRPYEVFVEEVL